MRKNSVEWAHTPMQTDQDWRPNPNEDNKEGSNFGSLFNFLEALIRRFKRRKTEPNFWEIFTGHSKVFGQQDIEMFIKNGRIILPPSELSFALDTPYQGVLHPSWLGICHGLTRIYVFDEDGFTELQNTLNTKGIPFKPLVSDLGIKVNTKIPTFFKNAKTKGIEKNETEGTVLFLKEQALKTPADALDLVVEIAQLNPNTFEELISSVLIRTRVVSHNIRVWRKVLADYEAGKFSELLPISALPQQFEELFNQIKSYLQQIPDALVEFEQRLTEKFTGLTVVPLEKIENPPLMLINEAIALEFLQKILRIIAKLQANTTEANTREIALNRLNRLEDILTENFRKNTEAVNKAFDPTELLLMVTMQTGKRLMLSQIGPSNAMIYELNKRQNRFLFQEGYARNRNTSIPTSVQEWLERMEIAANMTQLRNKLAQAEAQLVKTEEKAAYLRVSKAVATEIQTIMQAATVKKQQENLEWYEFPSHPVLDRWREVEQTINTVINDLNLNLELANKISAIFEAKRKLAEHQAYYTNLFLKTTIKYLPGGYDGWDKAKREPTIFLESFPYSAARLKELDCVGRTSLLSEMLIAAKVFKKEDLATMSTYNHIFLGSVDVLNVSRAIEGSGYPINSYYYSTDRDKDRNKTFYGEVFYDEFLGKERIIYQRPLSVDVLISLGNNYSWCLNKAEAQLLLLKLLQTSGYIEDLLWSRLSNFCQSYTDRLLCLSRTASISHFPNPLVKLYNLLDKNKDKILAELRKNRASPLLEYIKLNLLIVQKALTVFQFKPEFNENIDKIKFVLESLLSNPDLENIQIPSFWQKKYGPNLELATIEQMRTDLSNPNLFPKPISFSNEGRIIWQMPN